MPDLMRNASVFFDETGECPEIWNAGVVCGLLFFGQIVSGGKILLYFCTQIFRVWKEKF